MKYDIILIEEAKIRDRSTF